MLHFVLVAGPPAGVARLSVRLSRSLEATRVFDGELITRTAASTTWATAAIACPDGICPMRLKTDAESIVIVNGPALARHGDQTRLVDGVHRAFREGGTSAVASALTGTYNFVGVDPAEGLRAFGDCSGLFPLYWSEGPDACVISNRSSTVAAVLGRSGWNRHALAWVIGRANLFGENLPVQGVHHIPTGREAQAGWGAATIRLEKSPEWVWPEPSTARGREDLTPREWDDITDELVSNTRLLRNLDVPMRLALTGGKDSRLSLALAKAAGLQDTVTPFTSGGRKHPECELAINVATAAGFRHNALSAPTRVRADVDDGARQAFDGAMEWRRLRRQIFRYEGIVAAWDNRSRWAKPDELVIEGFVGELYRNGHEALFRKPHAITLESYMSMFPSYHLAGRRAGVQLLIRDEEAFETDWIRRWVRTAASEVRLDVLPVKFYVDQRLAHWTGPLQQNAEFVTINPLSCANVARKVLELSLEARNRDGFHLEVMKRAAPELLDIPLFHDQWASPLRPSPQPKHAAPPAGRPPNMYALTKHRPAWAFLERETSSIVRLFEEAERRTSMGTFCDMDKVLSLARLGGELQNARARELFCCIGVAMSMLGLAEPLFDKPMVGRVDDAGRTIRSPLTVRDRGPLPSGNHDVVTAGDDRATHEAAPGPTANASMHASRFERRVTRSWRTFRRVLPSSTAEAVRQRAKRVLRTLGLVDRADGSTDRCRPRRR